MTRLMILFCALFSVSCSIDRDDSKALPKLDCDNVLDEVSLDILRRMCSSGACFVDRDMTLGGVVVANDEGGNFNRRIVVATPFGGVEVLAGFYSLSTNYPVGRNIHLRLRGTTIELRNEVLTVGLAADYDRNPTPDYFHYPYLLRQHTCADYTITPPTVLNTTVAGLTPAMCGMLVEVSGLRLDSGAETWGEGGVPHLFVDQAGKSIGVRVSPYANFAAVAIPRAEISVRGVLYHEIVSKEYKYVIKPRYADDVTKK